jgi:hypothetical protein
MTTLGETRVERLETRVTTGPPGYTTGITPGAPAQVKAAQQARRLASTPVLISNIHRYNESLDRLLHQRIAQQELDEKGVRVINDLRAVLADLEVFLETKDRDERFQNLFMHLFAFMRDVSGDKEMTSTMSTWRGMFAPLLRGTDTKGMIGSMGSLVKDFRGTESMLRFTLELLRLLDLTMTTETSSEIEKERAQQRDRMFDELIAILTELGNNPAWQDVVNRGRRVREEAKMKAQTAPQPAFKQKIQSWTENPNFRCMEDDLKLVLDSLMMGQDTGCVDRFMLYLRATFRDMERSQGWR